MSPKSAKKNQKQNAGGKKGKKAVAAPPPPAEESSSEEEESSEEEMEVAKTAVNGKKTPNGVVKPGEPEESSEEDDSDDSDDEPAAAPMAEDSDSDDDSSEEESEEEAAPPKKKAAAKAEESSSEEEEDSDDEEEAEAKPKKGKKAPLAEAEDDDESEDDDDEEESEEEEMDAEDTKAGKKRKATKEAAAASPKKAKVEEGEEAVSLMVRNVAPEIEDKKITKFFKQHDIEITEVRRKEGKQFCWCDLADADDLDKALALSGESLKGSELQIEKARPRQMDKKEWLDSKKDTKAQRGGGDKDDRILFVKNIPYEATEDEVREHFEGVNEIRMPKRDDGCIKGFAFLEFGTEAEVDECMNNLQGSELGGKSLVLDYAGSKSTKPKFDGGRGGRDGKSGGFGGEPGKSKILFVKNLSYNSTQDSLRDAFDGAESARIATFQDSGKSRGFGFVEFSSAEAAQEAHDAMQGQQVDGRQVTVDFAAERGEGGGRGGGRGGGFGGRGGGGFGGRGGGGGRGGRGGYGGGRGGGGFGGRGGGRGGGGRGGRGGRGGFAPRKDGIQEFRGSKKTFD